MKYNENFKILKHAIKGVFKNGNISEEVALNFFKTDKYEGKEVISLVIGGIDIGKFI